MRFCCLKPVLYRKVRRHFRLDGRAMANDCSVCLEAWEMEFDSNRRHSALNSTQRPRLKFSFIEWIPVIRTPLKLLAKASNRQCSLVPSVGIPSRIVKFARIFHNPRLYVSQFT